MKKILIVLFSDASLYPPTLNALNYLSDIGEDVTFVGLKIGSENLIHSNVNVIYVESFKDYQSYILQGRWKKLLLYLKFFYLNFKYLLQKDYDIQLSYDPLPALFAFLCAKLGKKAKLNWYHNHDLVDLNLHKWSILGFYKQVEKKLIKTFDRISTPSEERLFYLPLENYKNEIRVIPNYPRLLKKTDFLKETDSNEEIKILYHGRLGENRGLEELLNFIASTSHIKISLTIYGMQNDYWLYLQNLAKEKGIVEKIIHKGWINSYYDLLNIINNFDIGWAAWGSNVSINYSTATTASNKIFEYMSRGLAVFLFDNSVNRKYFNNTPWVLYTDLSVESLESCLMYFLKNKSYISEKAITDFEESYNFEKVFFL